MPASPIPAPVGVLEHAAVGAPITRAGVSLFPIYLFQPLATPVVTGTPGALEITEADVESVPTLTVTSVIDSPFLLVEGETVAGGLQQRTLNVSVLVPPRQRLDIPVSCVEAGRWGGARTFSGSSGHVSRRVRRAKSATVAENLRRTGHKHSDQGAVWQSVGYELERLLVDSGTSNFADADEILDAPPTSDQHARLAASAQDLVDRGPLPGQCGVVVAHGSRIVAAEVFATPDLLAGQWTAMARAHVLDAPWQVAGRPSASKALRFLRRLAKADAIEADGVGLGVERHIRTQRMVGQMLTWDDAMVHASGFALAA
jgi:hypothetical protein